MKAVALAFLVLFAANAETRRVTFATGAEQKWPLQEFDAALPADWGAFNFLVMELRESTAQRFDLRVHTASGDRALRLAPVAGAWVRVAIPLSFITNKVRQGNDLAAVSNKLRPMMFINLSGAPGPLDDVREIGFVMPNPIGSPTLEIRSVKLSKDDPGDALLASQPVVDEFGQWIREDWPGKAKTLDALKAAWSDEQKSLTASGDFHYCKFGGYEDTKAKATGFFRVEKIDGRWWFVDPDGHLFLSLGANGIGTGSATPTQGREALFAQLPPPELSSGRGAGGGGASFYTWNLVRRYGMDFAEKWVDTTVRRMTAWGFNTVGNWSDARVGAAHRVAYVFTSRGWGESGPMGVADVYAPDFGDRVDRAAAQQCDSRKNDPYLLGYFLGNEPPWPGKESVAAQAILGGADRPLKKALQAFLADGDTPERRQQFLYQVYTKFVETVSAAIRRHDPNHLNLGLRFGSEAPPEIVKVSKIFDVYSLNSYQVIPNPREIAKVKNLIDRPILIGEFHFGVPGRGMTPGLRQTANQEERGAAYRFYVENAMENANVVGAHWFEWVDEPNTGRFDGENYNIGMLDVTDRPYRELIEAAKATHRRLAAVHGGKAPAIPIQGRVQ